MLDRVGDVGQSQLRCSKTAMKTLDHNMSSVMGASAVAFDLLFPA